MGMTPHRERLPMGRKQSGVPVVTGNGSTPKVPVLRWE